MPSLTSRLTTRVASMTAARFARADDGVAAVEFALIVPVMLFMFMGAVELSQAVTVDRRVSQVAATSGDLVARSETNIQQTEVEDIMKVGTYLMAPYPTTRLKVIIRSVASSTTSATDTKEKWRCTYDTALGTPFSCICVNAPTGTAYALPSGLVGVNDSVVIAETEYGYQPWPFDKFFKNTWTQTTPGIYTIKDKIYQKPRGQAAKLNLTSGTQC